MHVRHVALLCAAIAASAPLPAQTNNLVRSLSTIIGNAAAASRQRKIVGPITLPLVYEPAAGPVDAQNRYDPRNLDVAGVHLGMTVAEARAALRAAGYVDQNINSVELSYASQVTLQWAQRYHFNAVVEDRVINQITWLKGKERVRVGFIDLPDGPVVDEVHYFAGEGDRIAR